MTKTLDPQKYLEELKQGAILSSAFASIQIDNLKLYPAAMFPDLECELHWDLKVEGGDKGCSVTYNFLLPDASSEISFYNVENFEKRLEFIIKAVRTLLWSDTKVEFKANGKPVSRLESRSDS